MLSIYMKKIRNYHYYMEESVLLGTKPLVDSICHFIQDPSGVFSVCRGGPVALWLVCLSPNRVVRVRALPGDIVCVLGQDT